VAVDTWLALEKHLGSSFFNEVISQQFGLAPDNAYAL
jgi:hypothetical protein